MPNEQTNNMQAYWLSSWLDGGNQSYLEQQFEQYLQDPTSLSEEWRQYFQDLIGNNSQYMDVSHADVRAYFKNLAYKPKKNQSVPQTSNNIQEDLLEIAVQKLIFAYRLLGHLQSNINPIATQLPANVPDLDFKNYGLRPEHLNKQFIAGDLFGSRNRSLAAIIEDLRRIYCGSVGAEYMHILNATERTWMQENLEEILLSRDVNNDNRLRIAELIVAADGLEKYLGSKYPGAKRFSLEGCDSLLVGLDEIISCGSAAGLEEIVLAMTHRGRLNVLVNLLGKVPSELFDLFEDKHNMQLESGDVKYHQGFASDLQTPTGNIHLSLIFNPSHLEIVTPVATGSVRARQERRNEDKNKVLCVAIHGDAAFAGQGVAMEIINMSNTRGYGIGGTIHIIVNNQIGFTTSNPQDARSTLYCSDLGKMLPAPILHVNADDPEAVMIIFNLALKYRMQFNKDIIIDLVGYRRMGHNEADEPSATQPLMYKHIRSHPNVRELYSASLISGKYATEQQLQQMVDTYRLTLDKRDQAVNKRLTAERDWRGAKASDWKPYMTRDWRFPTSTKVPIETLKQLANARDAVPAGFVLDTRVEKIVDARRRMTQGEIPVDWGYGETLAYATLLNEGFAVRLSGQDSGRGTFFHRHAVWHDQNTGAEYVSLSNLNQDQAKFTVIDSILSEAAVLGFEYGYSTSEPRALTLWEAQFGDFANNAQVVIDQFISSGEQKWGRLSGLVMLLPHGYEGQGPEHSSARIERYLQLCAQHNMQVCIPSSPSQIFHLLRRQLLRPMRKPLIVITPKSLLRHRLAVSSLEELANGKFEVVISDDKINSSAITRVVLCSGKVYYELLEARDKANKPIAIIRVEQLYPFPETELNAELKKYPGAKEVIWCQEEPMNQGAWYSMQHHFRNVLLPGQELLYAGRPDSAAPAVGYFHLHEQQQQELIAAAIGER